MPPETKREARLWNFFNSGDLFYKINTWPLWAQNAMLLSHKKRNRRYDLMKFLSYNGLDPGIAAIWVQANDYRYNQLILETYDRNAIQDFIRITDEAYGARLIGSYFDMREGRVIR